jgi:UDP-N-acetylmuramate--alanine ligase
LNKKYYFIGIKGSGMSSLAHIMKDFGNEVAGSDIEEFVFTEEKLIERNILIETFEKKIDDGTWIYVIGNNFNEGNNQQVKTVKEKKYSFITYHNLLGQLSLDKCSIAVSGVHGKTSTTNLLSQLLEATEGTSYLIGDGNGKGDNKSDYFVFEACEYKNSFLFYKPYFAIITNMEMDHPDFSKTKNKLLHRLANL